MEPCDVLIIGGGPAGLTAAIYAGRARLRTAIVEKGIAGGQAANTDQIDNYPGFPEGITGPELSQAMEKQAAKFDAEFVYGDVTGLHEENSGTVRHFAVEMADTEPARGRTLIIATGADPVKLGVPGEERLRGRGVSYCATCDGAFFRDKVVAVVGGGDSALTEALFLTRYAKEVIIIHRRNELRAVKSLQEEAAANGKIRFVWNTVVREVKGERTVESLALLDKTTGKETELPANGVFIYVGMKPNTAFLKGFLATDDAGYVKTGEDMRTAIPGVFAAGDVRAKTLRQLVTAVADGAIAAMQAEEYLQARQAPARSGV